MAFKFTNKSPKVGAISNFFRQAVKKVSGTVLKGPGCQAASLLKKWENRNF